jgi:hypothetical protein
MSDKPDYVDLIGEATRQHRRRATPLRAAEREETSRLGRWPPALLREWKLDNLFRWKPASLKPRRKP